MIRHVIVDEEDLKFDFQEHAELVRELKGLANEAKLEFYSLYKQATIGPCNITKPGMFDLKGQAKFDAWKELGALSQSDAMLMYIDLYNSLDAEDLKNTDEEDEGKVKMSTLYQPDGDVAENNEDMWHACRHGDMVKVRECFGAQWRSAVDEEGRTLLHWAVDRDHPDLVQWFLEQGCSLDSQDSDGSTPLHYAVTCEYRTIVTLLLEHGANTDIKDSDGCLAAELCDSESIKECFNKVKIT